MPFLNSVRAGIHGLTHKSDHEGTSPTSPSNSRDQLTANNISGPTNVTRRKSREMDPATAGSTSNTGIPTSAQANSNDRRAAPAEGPVTSASVPVQQQDVRASAGGSGVGNLGRENQYEDRDFQQRHLSVQNVPVVKEHVRVIREEHVTPMVEREIDQAVVQQVIQPIIDRQERVVHHYRTNTAITRSLDDDPRGQADLKGVEIPSGVPNELLQGNVTHRVVRREPIVREHINRYLVEEIQPIIIRTIDQHEFRHVIQPVYERGAATGGANTGDRLAQDGRGSANAQQSFGPSYNVREARPEEVGLTPLDAPSSRDVRIHHFVHTAPGITEADPSYYDRSSGRMGSIGQSLFGRHHGQKSGTGETKREFNEGAGNADHQVQNQNQNQNQDLAQDQEMMPRRSPMNHRMHVLLDGSKSGYGAQELLAEGRRVLKQGATALHLIPPARVSRSWLEAVRELRGWCMQATGLSDNEGMESDMVPILIHDRVDVALSVGADGVVLKPEEGFQLPFVRGLVGSRGLVGMHCTSREALQAVVASDELANSNGCGPVDFIVVDGSLEDVHEMIDSMIRSPDFRGQGHGKLAADAIPPLIVQEHHTLDRDLYEPHVQGVLLVAQDFQGFESDSEMPTDQNIGSAGTDGNSRMPRQQQEIPIPAAPSGQSDNFGVTPPRRESLTNNAGSGVAGPRGESGTYGGTASSSSGIQGNPSSVNVGSQQGLQRAQAETGRVPTENPHNDRLATRASEIGTEPNNNRGLHGGQGSLPNVVAET